MRRPRFSSPTAKRVSGKTFRFEPNDQKLESASLAFDGDRCILTLRDNLGERRIACGSSAWRKGITALDEHTRASKVAARGAWTGEDIYTVRLCFYETPFLQTVTCRFAGDQLTLTIQQNVSFGPTDRAPVVGRMA